MPNPELDAEIARLEALKAEHAPLLGMIAGDPGMSPEVRRALVEHIYEEEDERLAKIAALSGGAAAVVGSRAAAALPASPRSAGLSVGSLRVDAPRPQGSSSVGSLRSDGWTPPRGGSVGSLRRSALPAP